MAPETRGHAASEGVVQLASGRSVPEQNGRPVPEAAIGRVVPEAEVQLLPPRLSAVLTQLRQARQQLPAGRRQNKVSLIVAFLPALYTCQHPPLHGPYLSLFTFWV